jgi:DNA-binding response OmpR family regulator
MIDLLLAFTKQILILTSESDKVMYESLKDDGFTLSFNEGLSPVSRVLDDDTPNLVVLDMDANTNDDNTQLIKTTKHLGIPLFAVLDPEDNEKVESSIGLDEIIFKPFQYNELITRIRRILWRNGSWDIGQIIRIRDLTIDQDKYEVSLAENRIILTFKEYQLLCLLAANPGKVYSRETLLNRIWDYDYFGGTRTVDVHIRRLRSKVEDANHLFIETVRNVGYRFISY